MTTKRLNVILSLLIGVATASVLGLTTDEIIQNVYDSSHTALRANIVAGGSGSGFISGTVSANKLTKGSSATVVTDSSITDNGTTVSTTEALSVGALTYNGKLNIADINSNSSGFTWSHRVELCSGGSGNYTATSPTSPTVGDMYTIINLDSSHTCILTRAGSQTFNGANTLTLAAYTAPTRQDEHCLYVASNNWVCEGPAT